MTDVAILAQGPQLQHLSIHDCAHASWIYPQSHPSLFTPRRVEMAVPLDITAEELSAITTVREAFDWVPWKGAAADAFMFHLGLDPNEPPRTYAAIAETMIDATFPQIGYLSEEQMVGLSPADMGKAKLAWQACRVKAKMEKTASMVEVEQKEAKDMAKAMSSRSTTATSRLRLQSKMRE